jgi:ribosomal protein S12 methylthiotransferase accessory factor
VHRFLVRWLSPKEDDDGQVWVDESEDPMSTMTVSFPGGKRVDADYGGFTIRTDQPPKAGGEGSAPQPFDLFLASIATCAGIYVKGYCDARGIPTAGLGLQMQIERDEVQHRVARLVLEITLPDGFPEKHREGLIRAADHCAVKKHILNPPAFEIHASAGEREPVPVHG